MASEITEHRNIFSDLAILWREEKDKERPFLPDRLAIRCIDGDYLHPKGKYDIALIKRHPFSTTILKRNLTVLFFREKHKMLSTNSFKTMERPTLFQYAIIHNKPDSLYGLLRYADSEEINLEIREIFSTASESIDPPLFLAVELGNFECLVYLLAFLKSKSPKELEKWINWPHLRTRELLLNVALKGNSNLPKITTNQEYAVKQSKKIVKYLLKMGANFLDKPKDAASLRPLMYIFFLVKDLDIYSKEGKSAFKRFQKIIQYMITIFNEKYSKEDREKIKQELSNVRLTDDFSSECESGTETFYNLAKFHSNSNFFSQIYLENFDITKSQNKETIHDINAKNLEEDESQKDPELENLPLTKCSNDKCNITSSLQYCQLCNKYFCSDHIYDHKCSGSS